MYLFNSTTLVTLIVSLSFSVFLLCDLLHTVDFFQESPLLLIIVGILFSVSVYTIANSYTTKHTGNKENIMFNNYSLILYTFIIIGIGISLSIIYKNIMGHLISKLAGLILISGSSYLLYKLTIVSII